MSISQNTNDRSAFADNASRATHVFFTLNNPTSQLDFSSLEKHGVTYLLYQKEKGEAEGTPHFQGVFSLKQQKRLSSLKKLPGLEKAHFERVKNLQAAIKYCSKEETRLEGPWTFGSIEGRGQGKRTDLADVQARLDRGEDLGLIAQDNFQQFLQYGRAWERYIAITKMKRREEPPTVLFFVGPSGVGKTRTALAIAKQFDSYFVAPMPKGSGWYLDGYKQQSVFILDEMDGNYMTPTRFNALMDRYPHQVAVHGGQVEFNSPLIIIISNYLPKYWWKNRNANQLEQTTRRIHATWFFPSTKAPNNIRFQNQHGLVDYVPFGVVQKASSGAEPKMKKSKF